MPSDVGPVTATQPLVIRPGKKAPLALDGKLYRGKLELVAQGDFLRVVNVVALESYLQGVVAGEVPFSWPAEVLKAQAVAARSYAIASLLKGKPFDLYADARSQMYLGVAGETPAEEGATVQPNIAVTCESPEEGTPLDGYVQDKSRIVTQVSGQEPVVAASKGERP